MLFSHILLFFLLGTSVVAIPLLPGYKNEEHRDLVQGQRPLLFIGLLQSVPTNLRFYYRIQVRNSCQPKFCVSNILQGLDAGFFNDFFEIHHDGSITFHQLLDVIPGEGLRRQVYPDVLTSVYYNRLLGYWRPVPSVSCLPQFYNP